VPVLPIPAEQCTIAFSFYFDVISIWMKLSSIVEKDDMDSPVGTP